MVLLPHYYEHLKRQNYKEFCPSSLYYMVSEGISIVSIMVVSITAESSRVVSIVSAFLTSACACDL